MVCLLLGAALQGSVSAPAPLLQNELGEAVQVPQQQEVFGVHGAADAWKAVALPDLRAPTGVSE